MGFLEKLKNGIKKTSETITKNIEKVLNLDCKIDDEFFDAIEEALIMSDVGVVTSQKISRELKKAAKTNKNLTLIPRDFCETDINGSPFLAVAATSDESTNQKSFH